MKKRYVLRNKRRFATVILVSVLITVFMGMIVNAGASSPIKNDHEIIKVRQGDTLWEIALNNSPKKDIREYIYEIKKLNNLHGDDIYIGQILILP